MLDFILLIIGLLQSATKRAGQPQIRTLLEAEPDLAATIGECAALISESTIPSCFPKTAARGRFEDDFLLIARSAVSAMKRSMINFAEELLASYYSTLSKVVLTFYSKLDALYLKMLTALFLLLACRLCRRQVDRKTNIK